MRYLLKQRFWSIGDDFRILDEENRERYYVRGRVFSIGDKLSMQDETGAEVAFIRERLLSWGPTYEITLADGSSAILKKELFTFFRCSFEIDGPGANDYEAQGDFMDHEYEITGRYGSAAWISKKWFSWTDSYGVEILDPENEVLLLATAVVIDMICHADKGD
jgi:uncharacterized protein YxjI